MMLVVEHGHGDHPKANSYVSLNDSDAYTDVLWGFDDWLQVDDNQKEKALIAATDLIDTIRFDGYKIDHSQPLQFPRYGTDCDDDMVECSTCCGRDIYTGANIPDALKRATFKVAYWLAVQGGSPYDGVINRSVKSFSMGDFRMEFNDDKEQGIKGECGKDEVTRDWYSLIAKDIGCYVKAPVLNVSICR